MNHFLKLLDYSTEELTHLLDLADQLKYEVKHGIPHPLLKGKTLGLIFQKSSTRTRVSFEVGMVQLGGYPLFLSANDLQIGRGEETKDTARVLSRYLDGIMIRTFDQAEVNELAEYGSIPIINGLTDSWHPCQILADLMTIREYKQSLEGLKLCYIGDGNNVASSLVVGCLKTGMSITVVSPSGYEPNQEALDFAKAYGDKFQLLSDVKEGVKDADVIYTDVWTSMGQEAESAKRKEAFAGYMVSKELVSLAKDDVIVLHCLPAHKNEEISEEVFEAHANEIFDQAENRMHAQKAILVTLMK